MSQPSKFKGKAVTVTLAHGEALLVYELARIESAAAATALAEHNEAGTHHGDVTSNVLRQRKLTAERVMAKVRPLLEGRQHFKVREQELQEQVTP